jgi:hypothetical protein
MKFGGHITTTMGKYITNFKFKNVRKWLLLSKAKQPYLIIVKHQHKFYSIVYG